MDIKNKLIKINLNQTISRFELVEIQNEKNRWNIFLSICFLFSAIIFFNIFISMSYKGLIRERLDDSSRLIKDANLIKSNYEKYNNINLSISQDDIDKLYNVELDRVSLASKLEKLAFDIPESMSILDFIYNYDRKEIVITLISEIDKYTENKNLLIENVVNNFCSDGDFNAYDLRPEKDNYKQQEFYKVILTLSKK